MRRLAALIGFILFSLIVKSQEVTDTTTHPVLNVDTLLRIRNLNPYFTLHVDSTLIYPLEINKPASLYYWYIKNSPVGLKINKDNGLLTFKAEKSFFLSGKLKYDVEYKVNVGVQNLNDPKDKVDTFFTIVVYNTDIVTSKVKPTVANYVLIDEGDTIRFNVQCDEGNFPIEHLIYNTNYPIKPFMNPLKCGDEFAWYAPYDFIKDNDTAKTRTLQISFIGTDRFSNRDTSVVKIAVRQNINYPERTTEYNMLRKEVERYVLQLKGTFMVLDKSLKSTKSTRTTFDVTSSSMALGGTVLTTVPESESLITTGKILPSVGVALLPVKEAVAPTKVYEQNSASLVRSSIKRLEYLLSDNMLNGDKDPAVLDKTKKLREELKNVQVQLIDVPIVEFEGTPDELDKYFNSPKVNKKYRLKKM